MVEAAPKVMVLKLPAAYLMVVVLSVPFHKPLLLLVLSIPLIVIVPPAGDAEFVFSPIAPQINVPELPTV